MRRILLLSFASLLAGPAAAQVGATGETTTDMTAKATCGTNSRTDTEKANTKFSRALGVKASYWGCSSASGGGSVGRYTDWRTRRSTTYARANANTSVYGSRSTSSGAADVGGSQGNGMKFTLSASSDTKGKLTILVGGWTSSKQSAMASVKFGNTTISWKAGDKPKTHSADVTTGKSGMVFETVTPGASALKGRGRAWANSYVNISFAAERSSGGKCEIKKGATGCGPTLTGTSSTSFFGHSITLNLANGWKNTFGLLVYSADGKTIAFGKCPVFSAITTAAGFTTDKDGKAKHRLFASARNDLQFSVQDIVLRFGSNGLEWQSSDTLDISCTKN